jgi:hypothetical protein
MTLARTKQLRRGGRSNPAVHPALAAHQYGSAGICRLEPPQLMHFDTTVNSSSFTSDQKVTGSSHVGRATSTILALVRRGKWRCNHQSGPRRTTSKPASIAALACPTSCVIKRAIFSSSIAARCKRSSERQSFSDELRIISAGLPGLESQSGRGAASHCAVLALAAFHFSDAGEMRSSCHRRFFELLFSQAA